LFQQIIWLVRLCDYPSYTNVVLVKHFVGGESSLFKYQLSLHEIFSFV